MTTSSSRPEHPVPLSGAASRCGRPDDGRRAVALVFQGPDPARQPADGFVVDWQLGATEGDQR